MSARYRKHVVRKRESLSGIVPFAFLGDVSLERLSREQIAFDDLMAVPGCFDATPRYAGKRGCAAYRFDQLLSPAACHLLELDGVHHRSVLFCNGQRVDSHEGGFTRFTHRLPDGLEGSVELVLCVDNRLDDAPTSLHHDYFDFYHYGGITRGVWLHSLPEWYLERVEVSTRSLEPPTVVVRCLVRAETATSALPFRLLVDDAVVLEERVDVAGGSTWLERELVLPSAKLWSPEQPQLHRLTAELGQDDHVVRFGVRTITTDGRRLLLNGNALQLRGVNRHESHPTHGAATPEVVKLTDVQLLKELNCNFVRGSHYPQDETFLDLCDELGLLVFEEAIGWQNRAEQISHAGFIARMKSHVDEMVNASFNHPSVILWGLLNEGESHHPVARTGYEQLVSHLKGRDPSRLVTYASNRTNCDLCLDLVDVVSINTYPGWYFGSLEQTAELLEQTVGFYRAAAGERPILVSEIGASALYGCRDAADQRWTEEYQAHLLDLVLEKLLADTSDCVGVCLWQFADCRTSDALSVIFGKPRGFNNKGLLDEYRRKKLAFHTVKRHFAK